MGDGHLSWPTSKLPEAAVGTVCLEQGIGAVRAPHPVQWLSRYRLDLHAHRKIEITLV